MSITSMHGIDETAKGEALAAFVSSRSRRSSSQGADRDRACKSVSGGAARSDALPAALRHDGSALRMESLR